MKKYIDIENLKVGNNIWFQYHEVIGQIKVLNKETRRNGKDTYFLLQFENNEPHWVAKKHIKECTIGKVINYKKTNFEKDYIFNDKGLEDEFKLSKGLIEMKISNIEKNIKRYEQKKLMSQIRQIKKKKGSFAESFFYGICRECKKMGLVDEFTQEVTNGYFEWLDNRRYDFVIVVDGTQYIIELHGSQHYKDGFKFKGKNMKHGTLKHNQKNDKEKRLMAYTNGFTDKTYFEIDCRVSDYYFILNNLKKTIGHLINFDLLNLPKIIKEQLGNFYYNLSDAWNGGLTTNEIAERFNLSLRRVNTYLDECEEGGMLVNYSLEEKQRRYNEYQFKKEAVVMINPDSKEYQIFDNSRAIEFEFNIPRSGIIQCCDGKRKTSHGYIFMYEKDFEIGKIDEYIQKNLERKEYICTKERKVYLIFIDDVENNKTYVFKNQKEYLKAGFVKHKMEEAFKTSIYDERFNVRRKKIEPSKYVLLENEIMYYDGLVVIERSRKGSGNYRCFLNE